MIQHCDAETHILERTNRSSFLSISVNGQTNSMLPDPFKHCCRRHVPSQTLLVEENTLEQKTLLLQCLVPTCPHLHATKGKRAWAVCTMQACIVLRPPNQRQHKSLNCMYVKKLGTQNEWNFVCLVWLVAEQIYKELINDKLAYMA